MAIVTKTYLLHIFHVYLLFSAQYNHEIKLFIVLNKGNTKYKREIAKRKNFDVENRYYVSFHSKRDNRNRSLLIIFNYVNI